MATFLVYDDIYLEHNTGMHPENSKRLINTVQHLKQSSINKKLTWLKPRAATFEEIAYIHSPNYIKSVEEVAVKGGGYLDADTVLSQGSYEAALYAAGGVLSAIDKVMESGNAFCLVRPPGHHARPNHGMGFCLFNNVAIGARYLQKKHKIKKVAIIDWDLHHGNGTQEAFYDDSSVLYISLHRYPYYPGTGHEDESGSNGGKGFTVNFPLDYSASRKDFFSSFEKALKTAESFKAEFILISAGFDTYKDDPLGGLGLEVEDYFKLTEMTRTMADKLCKGRIVSALEGGYSLDGIPLCIEAHLKALV
ncbi:MAG: histone deacetylase [Planctomycetes bacterium]|nr:histone deacetylase [Planctomycetota bacterium]